MASIIKTTCSGCMADVKIDVENEKVHVVVPSNGRRGSLHIPAHTVSSDLYGDDDLLQWECPACEYADSYDMHA